MHLGCQIAVFCASLSVAESYTYGRRNLQHRSHRRKSLQGNVENRYHPQPNHDLTSGAVESYTPVGKPTSPEVGQPRDPPKLASVGRRLREDAAASRRWHTEALPVRQFVRKNSLVTSFQFVPGSAASRSSAGRPPSAATAPASAGCRAQRRCTASRIHSPTNLWGTRFLPVSSSSGTCTLISQPFPYGSCRNRAGLLSTSAFTSITSPSVGETISVFCPSRTKANAFCPCRIHWPALGSSIFSILPARAAATPSPPPPTPPLPSPRPPQRPAR